MNKELIDAAQAVVDRWDSPKWKDEAPTADYIARLRAAIADADFRTGLDDNWTKIRYKGFTYSFPAQVPLPEVFATTLELVVEAPMQANLTDADTAMLAELMDNPPPPNEALTKAFERHQTRRPPMPILTDAQLWDIAYAYGRKSAQDTVVPDLLRDWKTGMKSAQDVCLALFQHFSSTPTTG